MLSLFVFLVLLIEGLSGFGRPKRTLKGSSAIRAELAGDSTNQYIYTTDYPYMLQLLYYGHHRCGAALVRSSIALTTWSCFGSYKNKPNLPAYTLIGGTQIFEDRFRFMSTQKRKVIKVVVHPNASLEGDYDLIVVKVDKPFKLNNFVNVINFPSQANKNKFIGKITVNLGWGQTEAATHSDILLKVYGRVFKCTQVAVLCVRGMFGGFMHNSDFGGPSVIQGKERKDDILVGVDHAYGGNLTWYVENLAFFSDWITEKIDFLLSS